MPRECLECGRRAENGAVSWVFPVAGGGSAGLAGPRVDAGSVLLRKAWPGSRQPRRAWARGLRCAWESEGAAPWQRLYSSQDRKAGRADTASVTGDLGKSAPAGPGRRTDARRARWHFC